MRHIFLFSIFCLVTVFSFGQNTTNPLLSKDVQSQKKWVDSIYNSMTLAEKVGQLYMVQVMSNQSEASKDKVINDIKKHHIGGIIYSLGGPYRQAKLNNELQAMSKVPMLIGMDAEWGLSMRLDSTYAFPWNMTLGAIKDNELVERAGKHIGEHCKRLGVHFNFAPDVDINTNPKNPIIGNRSFGEDRDNVTEKAEAFMKGMQGAGVLASAKHFPGHGDTSQDSHKTLPTIDFSEKRIDSVELYPYKKLIKEGLASVMVAHLSVPSLEPRADYPSSLSKRIVTDILKERLGFKGLIFTDALTMKGAANFSETGDIDLAAFQAGNDVMLMSEDVGIGVSKIIEAYNRGDITEARLELSVKKILQAKYKVGLNNYEPISLTNLSKDLNRLEDDMLYEELMENAITIVKNDANLLPLQELETKSIAYVKLGDDSGHVFFDELKKYTKVHAISADNIGDLLGKLQAYNTVIIGFHRSNDNPWKSYEFSEVESIWIDEIAKRHTVILDAFVKPYALADLKSINNIEGIVVSYQNSDIAQQKSAQLIFGALASKGKLPVSIGNYFPVDFGFQTPNIKRLGYTIPERVGMNSKKLMKIDSVAEYAVKKKMTPGIQLLVARKGKVIYNKNFGKHTYEGKEEVGFDDIYDVASLTKILATLPLVMELEEEGLITLDTKLSEVLPDYKTSNKKDVTFKSMLSHYARLKPWEPFYYHTLDDTKHPSEKYYRKIKSDSFRVEVAKNLFMRTDYQDSIPDIIRDSELLDRLRYRYSDFPYYILKKFIEDHYDRTLEQLTNAHFYGPLGANYTMYNPYHSISSKKIVPTEIDDYYRYQTVHGYVHDMGAAMQNGIGGHAGVFSNANDVAKIMQMYLQKGFYGNKRFFKEETFDKFNTRYYLNKDNRRAIGFDKPQLSGSGPTCGCVPMSSFGHSGFTGTYAWADPEEEIVYVFLANRTYPKSDSNLLLRANIRTDIQQLIYEAIED
ncbi:glycoside hydrolase family 3 N-terminal domain-containing protein [Tamlana sp. 2_MG-2023]|uniref:glycoside hydrolase family 3 N-terminal domain-containing protein n=1 Tax=unclassified Tamlana TaxID=2614803 RepID=UPI0026E3A6EC|nr:MULTISPECIES: glycoside hydrolase family 3 N-terminal domain-containing protein [unclassified Tamlana]MDO6759313.1 glycoside hydrolase family 3 N-terminal domain-containing protein [Tamlana sp. 2_MG-2023]MDO6790548.1 glycoside hydrolase family 3 N-terminal domain-containing protein [Tamlana sp. 1_MG-2023]